MKGSHNNVVPPPAAAQPTGPVGNFMNMVNSLGSQGEGQSQGGEARPTGANREQVLPVTGKVGRLGGGGEDG